MSVFVLLKMSTSQSPFFFFFFFFTVLLWQYGCTAQCRLQVEKSGNTCCWLHSCWISFTSPVNDGDVLNKNLNNHNNKKNHWGLDEISGAWASVPLTHPEGRKQPYATALIHWPAPAQLHSRDGERKWWKDELQRGQRGCRCLVNTWAWLTGGSGFPLNLSQILISWRISELRWFEHKSNESVGRVDCSIPEPYVSFITCFVCVCVWFI